MTDKRERKYFGTDGVRDIANSNMMTPEFAMKLGRAYMLFLDAPAGVKPKIAVGRDTRYSGQMIQSALVAGINSAGGDVVDLGVIPTPGVSYVLHHSDFNGGAVISASHNPFEYNGIKFLNKDGFKLTDDDELVIEDMLNVSDTSARPVGCDLGRMFDGMHLSADYLHSLSSLICKIENRKYNIAVDAANGAAASFVEPLYKSWHGKVTFLANSPNGYNINNGVGVTHLNYLCSEVVKNKSDIGIAYDGDTDRILMCDSKGRGIDGDIMLWIIGRWLASKEELGTGLVATVMSNMALEDSLASEGIKVFRCGVGDRYVLDMMRKEKAMLGGEQSGHIIALNYANTGDGLCSGILFLRAVEEMNEDISTLVDRFNRYPQMLTNVRIKDKQKIMSSDILKNAVDKAEKDLAGKGRMLLRPSGTEPLLRIFVESRDKELMEAVSTSLEKTINTIAAER